MHDTRWNRFFMRVIIALSLSVLVLFFSGGNAFAIWIDTYLKKVNTENVRSIKITLMRSVAGSWQKVDVLDVRFNGDGNLVDESRFTSEGVLQFEYTHAYDEKGRMTASKGRRMRQGKIVAYDYRYTYDEEGNQTESTGVASDSSTASRYTAEYDERGNFSEGTNYEGEEPVSRYVARYDQGNNLIEEKKYTLYRHKDELRHQLEYRHCYSYDLKNNLIGESSFSPDGSQEYRYGYVYDDRDNLVEAVSYAEDDTVVSRYVASYDSRNNLVESMKYDKEGILGFRHTAAYDSAGHLIRENNTLANVGKVVYEASYDGEGNLIEETHLGEDGLGGSGLDYKYSYCYDDRGNCTQETYQVFFSEKNQWKPVSRQTNEISYQR